MFFISLIIIAFYHATSQPILSHFSMDICIRVHETGEWTSSPRQVLPAMRDAYVNYKERRHYFQEVPHISADNAYIVYRPNNDPYLPTYIARLVDVGVEAPPRASAAYRTTTTTTTTTATTTTVSLEAHNRAESMALSTPIVDMSDVMAFIVDNPSASRSNWMPCRSYQAWAFRDFIYDRAKPVKKSYMSPYTSYLCFTSSLVASQLVTIDLPDLAPNIVFNVSRNDNNSVFFERNDASGSRVRMCDNEYARVGYLGFYTRITMDVGIGIVISPPSTAAPIPGSALLPVEHLSPPKETACEDDQCILCNHNKVNVKFSPCEHAACCSSCYSKFNKNECPLCRCNIVRLLSAGVT